MKSWHTNELDTLFQAILSLDSAEECYLFFEDICTVKELTDMSQRLKAAKMLRSGSNYTEIGKETGMSTATISRVSRCLNYGSGGYRDAIAKLKAGEN